MKRLTSWREGTSHRGGGLSIGNFDGVHLGHQAIIRELVQQARSLSVPAVVLTFEPHPMTLLRPDSAPRLTTADSKARLLEQLGVDTLIEFPPDRRFLELTSDEFFQQIVVDQLQACALVEGPNFFYGRDRGGSVETLRNNCEQQGKSLTVVAPTYTGVELVSSSRIRTALAAGDVARAGGMLGRPYSIEGIVTAGAGRGRGLGFPTANLAQVPTLIPCDGVYAGHSKIAGTDYLAAIHIGPNPTFGESSRKIEVHLLNSQHDLYSQSLEVSFTKRLRDLSSFPSSAALREQVEHDLAEIRRQATE